MLAKASKNLGKLNIKADVFTKDLEILVKLYEEIRKYCAELEKFLAADHGEISAIADKFASEGVEILANLREKVDIAEDLVADEFWPMASYQKLLNAF
jgi:glutamine synthetase